MLEYITFIKTIKVLNGLNNIYDIEDLPFINKFNTIEKILIISCLLTGNFVFSQKVNFEKLNTYFEALENNNKFMGSVAISENGKVIYEKSIGFADVNSKSKATKTTKYRVGSVSKTFTSVLIFKAIEENKLTLETKLSSFYSNIKNAEKITIGNLLNHRSGIHNFTNDENYLSWITNKKTEEEMLKIIENGGSDFEPNSKTDYSNSNFILLSYILQKIYKKPFSDLINEKIAKPIQLKNTYIGSKINAKNNESFSYSYGANWEKETETDMSIPVGAGAIVSTPSDLNLFAFALFNGKLVSASSLATMKTLTEGIGYGLFELPFGTKKSFGHNGSIDGFESIYSYFENEKIGFAITANGVNFPVNKISIATLNAIFGNEIEIPTFKEFFISKEEFVALSGIYSSNDIPLKITISNQNGKLTAQATGQSTFQLDATEKNIFTFEQAGIVLEFNSAEKKMILKQGGKIFKFIKDN